MTVAEGSLKKLAPAVVRPGGARALDMMVFLIGPFMQVLSLLPMALSVLSAALQGELREYGLLLCLGLAAGWLGLTAAAAVLAKIGGYGKAVWKSVLTFPIFMVSWLPLQVLSLVRRTKDWKIIDHTRSLSVGELTH